MKKSFLAAIIITCILLTGCGARTDDTPHRRTVFAMDTVMNLTVYGKNGEKALDAAEQELYRLDALLARGTEGSAVYTLNHEGAVIDSEVAYLLRAGGSISKMTDGAFDPTIAELLDLWGFGSGAGEHRVPTQEELDAALANVGEKHLHVDGEQAVLDLPAQLDLGGIAKGWAGERMFACMKESGIAGAVLDLGGDVALWGGKLDGPWRVAIKNPADESAFLGVLETDGDRFIMTSGVYERYFEENGLRYHHILDPKTGCPAESDLVSATVICKDGVWADALATACCVMGSEKALELWRNLSSEEMPFNAILVNADGRVLYTCDGFAPEANGYTYEKVA